MQILLANAKIMYDKADKAPCSTPLFESVADKLATEMARMDVEQLVQQLDCSIKSCRELEALSKLYGCRQATSHTCL